MPLEDAATLPHAAILALQGLRRRDGRTVGPGDRVLVEGASGNVGPFAVQIAKHLGAHVTGVCSTDKVELVRALGADDVIDYRVVDYTTAGERYDWILAVDCPLPAPARPPRRAAGRGLHHPRWRRRRLADALLIGPVASLATHRSMGLMLWWKPFRAEDVATLGDAVRAGRRAPDHRSSVSARPGRRGASLRGRRARPRQGGRHGLMVATRGPGPSIERLAHDLIGDAADAPFLDELTGWLASSSVVPRLRHDVSRQDPQEAADGARGRGPSRRPRRAGRRAAAARRRAVPGGL